MTLSSAVRIGRNRGRGGASGAMRAAVVAVLCWIAVAAPALAVDVSGWDHGAYGRLVLDWGRPVAVAVDRRSDRVVITADAPIDAPVGTAARRLSAYVDQIAVEDRGRRLVLMTTAPMQAERRPFDNGLVLDLRPASQGGVAGAPAAQAPAPGRPSTAPASTVPASGGEPLTVRGGEHGSFSRIVFDWTEPVTYRTEREGAVLNLMFDRPAQADFGQVNPAALARVGAIAQLPNRDGGMVTAITIPPDARVRFFDYGLKTVVDVLGGTPNSAPASVPAATADAEPAAEPAAPSAPDAAAASPPAAARRSDTRPPAADAAPDAAATGPPPRSEVAEAEDRDANDRASEERAPADQAPADPVSDERPSEERPSEERASAAAGDGAGPATGRPEPPPPTVAGPTPDSRPAAIPTAPGTARATLPTAEPETAARHPDAALDAPPAQPGATPFTATFDPGRPARLAAFARGDALWVVFAADEALDVAALLAQGEPAFGTGEVIEAAAGAALMWPLEGAIGPGVQPTVTRRGDTWTVSLTRGAAEEARPVRIERQPDFALGGRLLVAEPDADRVVGLQDPRVGDRLLVVPLGEAAVRLSRRHRLVGVELLPSGQGLVIRPLIDDLAVRPVTGGVEITRPDGLSLSPDTAAVSTPAGLSVGRVFDIPAWQGSTGRFVEDRRRLRAAVVDGPAAEIDQARLALARFYFAHGLGAEAEALADLVAQSTPGVADRPEFRALRGAIAVLTGDAERAIADLSDPELADDAEIELWRGAAAALAEDWPAARTAFENAGELISTYPDPFRDRFFVAAMEAALRQGDAATAEAGLEWLADDTDGAADRRPRIAYLRGEIAQANGRPDAAERWWRRAADSDDQLWRTRADLALIRQGLADGSLPPESAVERLEALRFAWRGDALEIAILETLADAAWAAGRHAEAFAHYDHAAEVDPGSAAAGAVAEMLPRRYRELLGGPALDETSPLAAYAVFEQRRDLLPQGEAGDRIVERVAESLASIDLLDRAAGLMEDLAGARLEDPAEIARVGARAAGLRLLDGDPRQALVVLDRTEPRNAPGLPTPMTAAGLAVDRAAAGAFEGAAPAIGTADTAPVPADTDDSDTADLGGSGPGPEAAADTPETAADPAAAGRDDLAAALDSAMADVLGEDGAAALAQSIEAVRDGANAGAPIGDMPDAGGPAAAPADDGAAPTAEGDPAGQPAVVAAPAGPVAAAAPGDPAPGDEDAGGGSTRAAMAGPPAEATDALLAERRLLRARALADLGRPERALALLGDDRSDLAEAARLDIAWSNRLWGTAAAVLARRVGDPPALGEPIDEPTARRVVDLAVATALAEDRAALDRLAIGFGPGMRQTDYANTFAVLTRSGGDAGPLGDLAAVRRQVEEIDTFESFLESYRERTTPALIN